MSIRAIMTDEYGMISVQDYAAILQIEAHLEEETPKKRGFLPRKKNSVDDESEEEEYIVCDGCGSKMLKNHTCTGRTSFMRLQNDHPEYHPETEVIWILSEYINTQMKYGKRVADMPIGSKYSPYAESVQQSLKIRFNQVKFTILHNTDKQVTIRCKW